MEITGIPLPKSNMESNFKETIKFLLQWYDSY